MQLSVGIEARFAALMQRAGSQIKEAAGRAVVRQTEETQGAMRLRIAGGLGARAANALRKNLYPNPDGSVAGFVSSAWWRPAQGPSPHALKGRIDILAAFERGDAIRPWKGKGLAIALPTAGRFGFASDGKRVRVTPEAFERRTGIKLQFVPARAGNPAMLVARANLTAGGVVQPLRKGERGGRVFARRGVRSVPVFIIVRSTKLPQRFDLDAIRDQHEERLAEKVIVEAAKLGLLD
jgi:hypothetical protein